MGGSSQSTPNLFSIPYMQLPASELSVALIGQSKARLRAVGRAIRVLTHGMVKPEQRAVVSGGTLRHALAGADVVLAQARYGGYEARHFDETFPVKYGIYGDEGLGPGGLASGWRSWPHLALLLAAVEAACPSAWVVVTSAPLGILMRCALTQFSELKVIGVCELPWTTLQTTCKALGVNVRDIRFGYAGVNHLGWLHHVRERGRDLVTEYSACRAHDDDFPSSEIIDACAAIPLKYLRLHYQAKSATLEQERRVKTRGQVLEDLRLSAMKAYSLGDFDEIMNALSRRPAPWYEHAIGPLVASLMGRGDSITFFLTTFNNGYLQRFRADDVLRNSLSGQERQVYEDKLRASASASKLHP